MEYQDQTVQELCTAQQTTTGGNSYESPSSIPMSDDHTCHFKHILVITTSFIPLSLLPNQNQNFL
jgi:hypothetical protein